jgi:glycosyltransferase involved in cell wall biosynthesis
MARVLESWGVRESVRIVPNGVDLDPGPSSREIPRSAFAIPEGEIVFVFTGRLGREKNLGLLLDAFRLHAGQRPRTHLLLVGGGPERAQLERQVADADLNARVHFAGPVSRESVRAHLSVGDAFVTASVTEVHSLAVLEALAAGLPVLAVASPGMVESVRPGETGLLAEAYPESLADSMTRLSADASLRQALARGAAASAEEHSSGLWATRMLTVYQEALARMRTQPPA